MKRYITIMATFLVAVFGGIAAINYSVDPAHLYTGDYIEQVIDGLARGKNVTNMENMDERKFRKRLIELHRGEHFAYIVIGSSSHALLSSETFGGAKTLNLECGASKLQDKIAFFQLVRDNNITADNYVLGINLMDFNPLNDNDKWTAVADSYYKFTGEESFYPPHLWLNVVKLENLFAASYLSASLRYALNRDVLGSSNLKCVDTRDNEKITYMPDGSLTWSEEMRTKPVADIVREALEEWTNEKYESFETLDPQKKHLFESLTAAMAATGANVIIFPAPDMPSIGAKVENFPVMKEGRKYMADLARQNGYGLIGDFLGSKLGLTDAHFYDPSHARQSTLDSLVNDYLSKQEVRR